MAGPTASVVVRSPDSSATIGAAFSGIRHQAAGLEIAVVDSVSTSDTLASARRFADRIVEIPPAQYRRGHAFNIGTSATAGEVSFALPFRCRAVHDDWGETALAHYGDDQVAGREWLIPPDDEHARLFHLQNYRRAAGPLGKYTALREAHR